MTASVFEPRVATQALSPPPEPAAPRRITIAGARTDRLFFAQVREDPLVELEALHPGPSDRVVVISSGGCTALSLLAAGAAEVHAVDLNRTQNHIVELKVAALRLLARVDVLAFLGATNAPGTSRLGWYCAIRAALTADARRYWDGREGDIARGPLNAGVGEQYINLVVRALRYVVQSPSRIDRLLACRTLHQQRALFAREWDNRRWRALYALLVNRRTLSRAYDPGFFAHVDARDFATHLRKLAEHVLTELPVSNNYFLHHMLAGRYPTDVPGGVPPYLEVTGARVVSERAGRLTLVDGNILEHLRTQAARSVDCVALSNICEWLTVPQIAELFAEIERVAADGARVVFRNYVGWTELPPSCARLVEDRPLGESLIRRDRSACQARVVVCRIVTNGARVG